MGIIQHGGKRPGRKRKCGGSAASRGSRICACRSGSGGHGRADPVRSTSMSKKEWSGWPLPSRSRHHPRPRPAEPGRGADGARPRGCDVPKHAPKDVQAFSLMCDVSTPRVLRCWRCAWGAHHPHPVPMRMGRTLTDWVEGWQCRPLQTADHAW